MVKAKDTDSQYRRQGSSVDGKLDARSRNKHYQILSLEELIFDDGRLREEAIGHPPGPSRPTEEEACINILFASLRDNLSAEENPVLILKLMDTPWQRVGEILGQGASQEVAAQQSGLSQPAVSWLVAFVWESCQQLSEAISCRTTRITRHDQREKLAALGIERPQVAQRASRRQSEHAHLHPGQPASGAISVVSPWDSTRPRPAPTQPA